MPSLAFFFGSGTQSTIFPSYIFLLNSIFMFKLHPMEQGIVVRAWFGGWTRCNWRTKES